MRVTYDLILPKLRRNLGERIISQKRTFAAVVRHSSMWPEATILLRSQRGYSRPEAETVSRGLRPQLHELKVMIT
jgi:hypothetical protein